MTVTILGKPYPVVLPQRHAERHELCTGYATNTARGAAAILGLCVPAMWEPAEKGGSGMALAFSYKSCGYDVGEFGARVWDVLHVGGVVEADFIAAAAPVFMELVSRTMPTAVEVKDRVGFSGASAEP